MKKNLFSIAGAAVLLALMILAACSTGNDSTPMDIPWKVSITNDIKAASKEDSEKKAIKHVQIGPWSGGKGVFYDEDIPIAVGGTVEITFTSTYSYSSAGILITLEDGSRKSKYLLKNGAQIKISDMNDYK
jgi:flagellar basal body L-ring protein FlgH